MTTTTEPNRGRFTPPIITLSHVSYCLGSLEPIDTLPELRADADVLANLGALGLKAFSRSEADLFSLAAQSAEQTLKLWGGDRVAIDAVVLATSSLAETGPTFRRGRWMRNASTLLEQLRLPRAIPVGVFLAECANFASALRAARNLILANDAKNVLLVVADKTAPNESRILPPGIAIKSDGAASCVLSDAEQGEYRLLAVHELVDPQMPVLESGMDLGAYLRALGAGVQRLSREACAKASLVHAQIEQLLTNNYNLSALRLLASQAGFDMNRLFKDNIGRYAHCFSADNLINLKDYTVATDHARGGNLFLLCSGPNNWGSVVLRRLGT